MTSIVVKMTMEGLQDSTMPLRNRLKEYRAKIGVTQDEMGKMVGITRQTVSHIERGECSPPVIIAIKIAKIFNVNVEDIFEYVGDEDINSI